VFAHSSRGIAFHAAVHGWRGRTSPACIDYPVTWRPEKLPMRQGESLLSSTTLQQGSS
jgi:hypothetical protein